MLLLASALVSVAMKQFDDAVSITVVSSLYTSWWHYISDGAQQKYVHSLAISTQTQQLQLLLLVSASHSN
jgi:hypothetical protein